MSDDGGTKDDVKLPEGEIGKTTYFSFGSTAKIWAGDKIEKLFRTEEKDTNVIVLTAMGEECAIDAKEAPRS